MGKEINPAYRLTANEQTIDALAKAAPLGRLDKKGLKALDEADGKLDGHFELSGLSEGDKAALEHAQETKSDVLVQFPLMDLEEPDAYFLTQFPSRFNTKEDVAKNGNCGPASLTMAARAFGKYHVTPAQVDKAVEDARKRMTGKVSEGHGTSVGQIAKGAESLGLSADVIDHKKRPTEHTERFKQRGLALSDLSDKELAAVALAKGWKLTKLQSRMASGQLNTVADLRLKRGQVDRAAAIMWLHEQTASGKLVVCLTNPKLIDPSYKDGGHYLVVRKIDADGVHYLDPGRSKPEKVVPLATFMKGWREGAVAIGPGQT